MKVLPWLAWVLACFGHLIPFHTSHSPHRSICSKPHCSRCPEAPGCTPKGLDVQAPANRVVSWFFLWSPSRTSPKNSAQTCKLNQTELRFLFSESQVKNLTLYNYGWGPNATGAAGSNRPCPVSQDRSQLMLTQSLSLLLGPGHDTACGTKHC